MCMVHQVIGTAVPASPEGRQRQEGAAGDRRSDLRRQAMGGSFGTFRGQSGRGAGRGDLPLARRGSRVLRSLVSKAGRKSGYPKKGRGTSDGFGREMWVLRSRIGFSMAGRTSKDKRTFGQRSRVEGRAPLTRELLDGKRRLSW